MDGSVNPPNPKQRFGDMKVPLGLFPSSAVIYGALACADGAAKYGAYNWRDKAVEAMTYVHAAERHLRAWMDGEELAGDSGKPHLGHVLACIAILVDAIEQGNLIDNRPLAGSAPRLLEKWAKNTRMDDEVLTSTFGPKENYAANIPTPPPPPVYGPDQPTGCADDCVHPAHRHGRPGRRSDEAPIQVGWREPANGADTLGWNSRKVPCQCRDLDRCKVEAGFDLKYVFCRKAEEATEASVQPAAGTPIDCPVAG